MEQTYNIFTSLDNPNFSDITIIIKSKNGDKKLYASKILLTSVEYFRNIFQRWTDKKEIILENSYNSPSGEKVYYSEDILEDFVRLVYSITIGSTDLFNDYLKAKYLTLKLQYILDLVILGHFYQINEIMSEVVKELISNGIIKINDYRDEIEKFNEFILSVDPSILKNVHLKEMFRVILTNFTAQAIFGTKIVNAINNNSWTNSIMAATSHILLQYLDITDQASINTILSIINDPERSTLKFYLNKVLEKPEALGDYLNTTRTIFNDLSTQELAEFCSKLGIDGTLITKKQLADMLFEKYRDSHSVDIIVFITKISDCSLEDFILQHWSDFLETTMCLKAIEEEERKAHTSQRQQFPSPRRDDDETMISSDSDE